MTTQHVLYIPIVFLLGLVFGTMLPRQATSLSESGDNALKKRLLQSFLIFILFFVVTHVFEIPGGAKSVVRHLGGSDLFDRRPSFSASAVYERIQSFSDYGRAAYKRFTYTIDILFPLSFLFFLSTFARYVRSRVFLSKPLARIFIYLPFAWFISDMIENATIFSLLSLFPNQNSFLGNSLGIITAVKFTLLALSILAPSVLLIGQQFFKKDLGKEQRTA
jgi:hypothetical protein